MIRFLFFMLIPGILFASQLTIFKSGGNQNFDLTNLRITFPTENSIKLNTTIFDLATVTGMSINNNIPVYSINKEDVVPKVGTYFNDKYFNVHLKESGIYSVLLYDIKGRLVKSIYDNEYLKSGEVKISFNKSSVSSGVYYLKVNNNNSTNVYPWRF